ncbi:hypothetical protein BCR33DRAFT_779501 [Rhizoclosmatium globosum]|uniref:Heat shock factor binding protein 1 n=1 Tax=Rhizoclosmatium globosum TaxID=329046 RepID=A0A1Y2D1L7_9FUNG|nr:hypothetical protein BCR33DRAFT_779501 [Rhizoclosmatium globosum]|eukprot:ORY53178.1 hypothetical protein BCR33DRAFT_779501 [Rhizoclosmatium globosum]
MDTTTSAKGNPQNTPSANSEELSAFVESLLAQMQSKFNSMSSEILGKSTGGNGRENTGLETNIEELVKQADADESAVNNAASAAVQQHKNRQ